MGAGRMLLENLIGRLGNVESVKLDATPAGEPLYRKLGFIPEYKIFRMGCRVKDNYPGMPVSKSISYIDRGVFKEILQLDSSVFGADRSYLLNHWLDDHPSRAFCIKKAKSLKGYVFGRDGSRFNYIGPLASISQSAAAELVLKSLEPVAGQSVAIDIPEDKEEMIGLLESEGFMKQRHFVRMYLGKNPYPGMVSRQYLISGPEFG
jgi:hypothetical protein